MRYEDGRCGAWARFFSDMIKAQGIGGATTALVTYPPPADLATAFVTDKILFFGAEASNVATVYEGVPGSFVPNFYVNDFELNSVIPFYLWDQEWMPLPFPDDPLTINNGNILNFAPQSGAEAQGNDNPQSTFADHGIVKYNSKYYDPSYGTPIAASKNEWETNSLAGFGTANFVLYVYYSPPSTLPSYRSLMYLYDVNRPHLQATIHP